MTTKDSPPPIIKVSAPDVTLEPKFEVFPTINVAPSETNVEVVVQTMPAPKVEVTVPPGQHCPWVFNIERDKDGSISRVIANPQ